MLILGIFLGIDSAEKNIQKMQGTEGAPRAIQVTPVDGKIQIQVLGQEIIANTLGSSSQNKEVQSSTSSSKEKKQISTEQSSKINTTTVDLNTHTSSLAQMGNNIGDGVRSTTRKLLDLVFGWTNNKD